MAKSDYSTNLDHIIVLDNEPGGLVKKKILVPAGHEEYLEKFKLMAEDEDITFENFLDFVENDEFWNSTLRHTFRFTRHSTSYNVPWNGISTYSRYDLSNYLHLSKNSIFDDKYSARNKKLFIEEIEIRILAFKLKGLYEESDSLIKEGKRILYSHRKDGWNFPEFFFNDNFSAGIETNFGFGNSSFFYTVLNYKGLKIIPYLRLVDYPFTNEFHFCEYTEKFNLHPYEWDTAIDYCLKSFTLAITDEQKFIDEYIISQAREMVDRLEFFLQNNDFQFKKFDGTYYRESFTGPKLIAFRAVKISHALLYMESIQEFEKILETNLFSDKIIPINRKLYPILLGEIEKYQKELEVLEDQKDLAEEELSKARKEEFTEEGFFKRFKEEFTQVFSKELHDLLFYSKQYEKVKILKDETFEKRQIFNDLKEKHWYLWSAVGDMESGKVRIEEYFEKHELSLELNS